MAFVGEGAVRSELRCRSPRQWLPSGGPCLSQRRLDTAEVRQDNASGLAAGYSERCPCRLDLGTSESSRAHPSDGDCRGSRNDDDHCNRPDLQQLLEADVRALPVVHRSPRSSRITERAILSLERRLQFTVPVSRHPNGVTVAGPAEASGSPRVEVVWTPTPDEALPDHLQSTLARPAASWVARRGRLR
jgi:hypothetical protein